MDRSQGPRVGGHCDTYRVRVRYGVGHQLENLSLIKLILRKLHNGHARLGVAVQDGVLQRGSSSISALLLPSVSA